jgi:hypothetical protein
MRIATNLAYVVLAVKRVYEGLLSWIVLYVSLLLTQRKQAICRSHMSFVAIEAHIKLQQSTLYYPKHKPALQPCKSNLLAFISPSPC